MLERRTGGEPTVAELMDPSLPNNTPDQGTGVNWDAIVVLGAAESPAPSGAQPTKEENTDEA